MSQAGGPTTESGIVFQNSVASLFLGDLLHKVQKLPRQIVTGVRVEAPTHVDDTVVTYADSHRVFIQAKEHLQIQLSKNSADSVAQVNESVLDETEDVPQGDTPSASSTASAKKVAWVKLWQDFEAQFFETDFQKQSDRLCLYIGHITGPLTQLSELCASAQGSNDSNDWFENLPKQQIEIVEGKIRPLLKDENRGLDKLWELLKHVDVEADTLERIQEYLVPLRMPKARHKSEDYSSANLFDLLLAQCGRNARFRKEFDFDGLCKHLRERDIEIESSPAIEQLRDEVNTINSVILGQRVTIGQNGEHIPREITNDIVRWLTRGWKTEFLSGDLTAIPHELSEVPSEVGLLHDKAGMGKSVVMHDVLEALMGKVPVIAIKADSQLLKLREGDSLEDCLGLSQSLPRVAYRLAQSDNTRGTVVLIDQVDALSMALARDQGALDKVAALVQQLRSTPGVRVLISCRTFDLNNDPTLKQLPRKIEFAIEMFSQEETEARLDAMGVTMSELSSATRELLRIPLHLDLLALALEHQPEKLRSAESKPLLGGLQTLQDLHALLWENVIEDERLNPQEIAHRRQAVELLAAKIAESGKLTAPSEVFTSTQNAYLRPVAQALASAGVLVNQRQDWSFWHQTFFDYVSARAFVVSGNSLSESILSSEQGLSERPRMLQILTYLRDRESGKYGKEVLNLFESHDLVDHLGDLLMRWFGALSHPSEFDWEVAQVLLSDDEKRVEFLQRAESSGGWLRYLSEEVLPDLFVVDDPTDDVVNAKESLGLNFLRAMLNRADSQAEAAQFLIPHVDESIKWNSRLALLLSLVVNWHSNEAIELYKEVTTKANLKRAGNL